MTLGVWLLLDYTSCASKKQREAQVNYHRNLGTRVQKAKATTATVVNDSLVRVQGSKSYTVKVSRTNGTMNISCQCQGNKHTICYHGMIAIVKLAKAKDYKVSFCISQEHARRLARIGGKVYHIKSDNGDGELWMVAQMVKASKDWREAHLENIKRGIKAQETALENNAWSFLAQTALNNLVATRESLQEQLG